MRNLPVFTTEHGAASLVLEEIPYKKEAYIKIQSTLNPEIFLTECVDFCRMAGATKVFATGHKFLDQYQLHTKILLMQCDKTVLPETTATAVLVSTENAQLWCELYNSRMKNVSNAVTMTARSAEKILREKDCYFVYKDECLIGLGKAKEEKIEALAALVPGGGMDTALGLAAVLNGQNITLEVASTNEKAVVLYKALGFKEVSVISSWYRLL